MTRYAKAVLAAILAVSTWGMTAAVDGTFDAVEWFGLLGAIATALGTYFVPNTPPDGETPDPTMSEQHVTTATPTYSTSESWIELDDRGHVGPAEAVVVLLLIVAIALLVL